MSVWINYCASRMGDGGGRHHVSPSATDSEQTRLDLEVKSKHVTLCLVIITHSVCVVHKPHWFMFKNLNHTQFFHPSGFFFFSFSFPLQVPSLTRWNTLLGPHLHSCRPVLWSTNIQIQLYNWIAFIKRKKRHSSLWQWIFGWLGEQQYPSCLPHDFWRGPEREFI